MTNPPQKPESNGLAVASLVLGILSLTGGSIIMGIPAIITGFFGLKNPVNKNMSIAGIVMGGISVVLAILFTLAIILLIAVGALSASEGNNPVDLDYSSPSESSNERSI